MRKIVPAAALVALMAACSNMPTSPSAKPVEAAPRFDGGFTMGSGNFVGTGGNGTETPTQTQTATAPSFDAVAADTTSRGGFTMGSGN